MLQLDTAGLSDLGRKRSCNEDAFVLDDALGLYVVADGMGGHLAGEIASAMTVEVLRRAASGPGAALPADRDRLLSPEAQRLRAWITAANREVFERSQRDARCRGMGSTVAALYCIRGRAVSANVGDSPVYRVRGNTITPFSAMHTVAAEQSATPVSTVHLPEIYHHMLTRAIGIEMDVRPHIQEADICVGDVYILCSDGISNAVDPREMRAIVQQADAGAACRRLVDLALERGGNDNATVVVINVRAQ